MAGRARATARPPILIPVPLPAPLPSLLLLLLWPNPAASCSGLKLNNLGARRCPDAPSVAMRNWHVQQVQPLGNDCMLNMNVCFNVTRPINITQVNYSVKKDGKSLKNGNIDYCTEMENMYQKEAQNNGGGGGRGSGGNGGKQGNNRAQGQKKNGNKYAALRCPLRVGRRCITERIDLSSLQQYRRHLQGPFSTEAVFQHGQAGSSCLKVNFTVEDAKAGR